MGEFADFLNSDTGQIISGALLMFGIADLFIAELLFGKIVKALEASISPAMHPDEKATITRRMQGIAMAKRVMIGFSVVLIGLGIYGLTR